MQLVLRGMVTICSIVTMSITYAQSTSTNLASCHVQFLSQGQSHAYNYRIQCPKKSYVLRQLDLNQPKHLLEREFINSERLSALPIAPSLLLSDRTQGIMRLEYIDHEPIDLKSRHPRLPRQMARTLYKLHHGPALPYEINHAQEIDRLMARLYPKLRGLPYPIVQAHRRLQPLYQTLTNSDPKRPCHNDLHPFNILQNQHSLWLIDWETAAMGSPWFDLATVSNFFQFSSLEEHVLLNSYLQHAPSAQQEAQFYLMRQVSLLYFSLRYLDYAWHGQYEPQGLFSANTFEKQLKNLPPHYFESMNPALVAYDTKLNSAAKLQDYALALSQKLCSNMASSRFDHAVATLQRDINSMTVVAV